MTKEKLQKELEELEWMYETACEAFAEAELKMDRLDCLATDVYVQIVATQRKLREMP